MFVLFYWVSEWVSGWEVGGSLFSLIYYRLRFLPELLFVPRQFLFLTKLILFSSPKMLRRGGGRGGLSTKKICSSTPSLHHITMSYLANYHVMHLGRAFPPPPGPHPRKNLPLFTSFPRTILPPLSLDLLLLEFTPSQPPNPFDPL